jgi:hypothetical protein
MFCKRSHPGSDAMALMVKGNYSPDKETQQGRKGTRARARARIRCVAWRHNGTLIYFLKQENIGK